MKHTKAAPRLPGSFRRRAVCLALLALPTACSAPTMNSSAQLDGATLAALEPDTAPVARGTTPSVTGIDRSAWPTVVVVAPMRQVSHNPGYVHPLDFGERTARAGSAAPTTATALETVSPQPEALAARVLVEPVHSAYLLLASPFEMIFAGRWPWTTVQGPEIPYQRVPEASNPAPAPVTY